MLPAAACRAYCRGCFPAPRTPSWCTPPRRLTRYCEHAAPMCSALRACCAALVLPEYREACCRPCSTGKRTPPHPPHPTPHRAQHRYHNVTSCRKLHTLMKGLKQQLKGGRQAVQSSCGQAPAGAWRASAAVLLRVIFLASRHSNSMPGSRHATEDCTPQAPLHTTG